MQRNKDKLKKDDRIILVGVIDGEKPLSSIGMVDKRLFTGDNKLHAKYNPMTGFWKLNYEVGILPPALDQAWTSFEQLRFDVSAYFFKRNIEIKSIIE